MNLKDIIHLFSSYRTLIICDYESQEKLKVYEACDIRFGSPFEDLDVRKAIDRSNNIKNEFGEYDVMLITSGEFCIYLDVVKGVI